MRFGEIQGVSMATINFFEERTVKWNDEAKAVTMIDQSILPERFELIDCRTVAGLVNAIKTMRIRGAPAIGVAGAMGVVLSVIANSDAKTKDELLSRIQDDALSIRNARPTAVNLSWGVDQALRFIRTKFPDELKEESIEALIDFVKDLGDQDVAANRRLGSLGQKLFPKKASVLTHCN
jgi:methylthioribose-1-phosphate isomerase